MSMKEKALKRMAEKLNAAGVTWAIGGSWMLSRRGVVEGYHDFDIVVDQKDADTADHILSGLGMKNVPAPKQELPTELFCEYHFDGADIDMMSGMAIRQGEQTWHVPFDASFISETVTVLGTQVPMMYLEDWLILYSLMGRESRVQAIEAHLKKSGAVQAQRFAQAVTEPLPDALRTRLQQLIEEKQA